MTTQTSGTGSSGADSSRGTGESVPPATGEAPGETPAPAAGASTAPAAASHDAQPPSTPGMVFLATFVIDIGEPLEIGPTTEGTRRLIPILGGTVRGPLLNGKVLPGGADFQLLRSATLTELEAKYSIETDSGERIYVTNFGVRSGSAEDIAALVRGDEVDPARIYFRCTPRLLSGGPEWAWLSSRILVGSGTRLPSAVRISIWVLD
ncbi:MULTISPECIES: DUF3237 domain-containing protein [unclassified Arthrobacter]|uniref:DUF3237 domain-containing protein n=1 Tax=unclassified Arthrobacter TaxID=235627 RepID=UPI0021040F08|nr:MULTISPECIES: DUF3237 domain-containing protein [unclassified Arthrobacter]MCQ1945721.1 DUF3237 domain-containing protein [Arthrobacter sp. zg-Y1116]MCQ1994620.1 DUF3237 domain-containing protein [Arthrobacter sp. zg-Y1171]UWX81301.1 DUF3237 domain-containing protein [Arthrobacter sp. zg-Y1171]